MADQERTTTLHEVIAEQAKYVEELRHQVAQRTVETDTLRRQLSDTTAQLTALQNENFALTEQSAELGDAATEKTRLQRQLRAMTQKLEESKMDFIMAKAQSQELRVQLDAVQGDGVGKENANYFKNKIAELSAKNQHLEDVNDTLAEQVAEKTDQLENITRIAQNAEKSKMQTAAELAKLHAELAADEAEKLSVKLALDEATATNDKLQHYNKIQSDKITELAQKIDRLADELTRTRVSLAAVQLDLKEEQMRHRSPVCTSRATSPITTIAVRRPPASPTTVAGTPTTAGTTARPRSPSAQHLQRSPPQQGLRSPRRNLKSPTSQGRRSPSPIHAAGGGGGGTTQLSGGYHQYSSPPNHQTSNQPRSRSPTPTPSTCSSYGFSSVSSCSNRKPYRRSSWCNSEPWNYQNKPTCGRAVSRMAGVGSHMPFGKAKLPEYQRGYLHPGIAEIAGSPTCRPHSPMDSFVKAEESCCAGSRGAESQCGVSDVGSEDRRNSV
eukprot:TRINITY_DN61712_c0_g1_i1.p1 TRINITY_DN61712_c0_g1~~TRINITY_DN61712_c0_g1_i1.p1  ORF type:complete len:497 (+),score=62.53 TRINITY_DN61712_c0_g1_i1:71-1561(+)